MDPNYVNPTTPETPAAPTAPAVKPEEKSIGPVVAIIIIVVVVLIGGFYVWRSGIMQRKAPVIAPTTVATTTPSDIANIEADLGNIDIGSSSELDQLETKF